MTAFGPQMEAFTVLESGIRRLVAPNPSMMTGPGTNTYLFGREEVAVLDPGPAIREHIDDIIERAGAPIRWVLVTHTHPDHSPGARLLADATGAELLGQPAPEGAQHVRRLAAGRRARRAAGDGHSLQIQSLFLPQQDHLRHDLPWVPGCCQ